MLRPSSRKIRQSCPHIHTHPYPHVHIHRRTHTYTHTHTYPSIPHVHTYRYTHAHIHTYTHFHAHTLIHPHTHTHTPTHPHTHTPIPKIMINKVVLERFDNADKANAELRRLLLTQFAIAYAQVGADIEIVSLYRAASRNYI